MDIYKPMIALLATCQSHGSNTLLIDFSQGFSAVQRQRTIQVSPFSVFVVTPLR